MAAYLRIFVLYLLVTLSLQEDPETQQHRVERRSTASGEYKELLGTFDDDLKNDLGNLAIGTKSLQDQFGKERGKLVSEGGYLQNSKIITHLNKILSQRLKDKITAVNDIVTQIVRVLITGKTATEEYHECCYLPDRYKRAYNPLFKDKVTLEVFCQVLAPNHLQKKQFDFKEMKTVFDKNVKKSSLRVKWQYFGSAEGVLTAFPGYKSSDCDGYDNRIRPWYVATATPSPKNIIILLDCSTSMGKDNSLKYAKESANVVLNTLHPLDKVSVMVFNASTYFPGDQQTKSCYSSTMAIAGVFNIKNLESFVESTKPKGGTRYIKAFKKAFEILGHTLRTSPQEVVSRPSMMLLLTNDGPEEKRVQEIVIGAVKEEFQKFRDDFSETTLKLLIMSFGKEKKFFDQLAHATNGISISAQGKSYTHSRLKPYFDYLMEVTPAIKSKVVFSPPYVDAFGLGYMITAACAVIDDKNKFRGVVGVDILMPDLVSDVQYFRSGSLKSYAFMFHTETGVTLSHPKLPSPETIAEDPNAVNILQLEQSAEFKELFYEVQKTALAKKLDSSSKLINGLQRSMAMGGVMGDGVKVEQVNYKYTCQPLDIAGREYITCIAIKEREAYDKYATSQIIGYAGSHPITYHRMDVIPEAKTCYHTDTLSYADRSVIKFNAKAFVDPVGYFEEEESPKAIRRYVKQLFDETHNFQMHEGKAAVLQRNVATVAALTSYLDRIVWASGSTKFKQYTTRFVRRFVGTYNGVLRVFPGAPLPTNFDHVTRPWFLGAVANDGNITVTHPYLDPLGAGFIVTVSHTVRLDAAVGNDHKIYAVVGGDLTISSFGASLLTTMGKKCANQFKLQCFLMDTSGYIIYHPNFENAYNGSSKVVGRHITEVDGAIARNLIKNGMMKRRACKNFNNLKLQRFYQVEVPSEIYNGKRGSKNGVCDGYTIARIPNTNVFVVWVNSITCLVNADMCPCNGSCTSGADQACECPCVAPLEYDICNANLTAGHDLPLCGQPSPPVSSRKPLPEHPDDLGKCIKAGCGKHKSKLDCNENFGCVWCYKSGTDGSLLKHPSCKQDRDCYNGELGRPNPFLLPFKPRKPPVYVKLFRLIGLEFTLKTLIIVGTSVVGGLLVLILFVWCLCKRKNKWTLDLDEMFGDGDLDMEMMDFAGQEQSTMPMGSRLSTMQMGHRQSAMHMGHRQSAMHMGQRPSAMHMGQRPSAMHMGQRPSAMQMQLNAPGVQYSTQAMSAMWSQGYGQSQMNFAPQVNTPNKRVSFSANAANMDDDY